MYGIYDTKINLEIIHALLPHDLFQPIQYHSFPEMIFVFVEENTKEGADETVYHYITRRGRPN